MIDFQGILNNIHDDLKAQEVKGIVASYIPELSKKDVNNLGLFMQHVDGRTFSAGDAFTPFSNG